MEKLIDSKLFVLFGIIIVLAATIYIALDYFEWPEKAEVVEEELEVIIDEGGEVFVNNGEGFVIKLESNPTTGYSWQVQLDSTYVELVSSEYVPLPAEEEMVGVGGEEIFTFLASAPGQTEIIFSYLWPWEEGVEPIETLRYQVNIE